jgi:hypothetical protein
MSNFVGKRPNPLAAAIQGASKLFGKKQKTTGREVIDKIKPGTKFEGTPKYQKEIIKARSEVQKKFKPINEGIANQTKQLRQTLQGMRGERITQSGISKGKDVGPGIYEPKKKIEKKAKGGRIGLKGGSFPDLSGDGKTTMQDILIGRGVIPKPKNKKKMVAKKTKTPMEKAIKKNKKKII